MAKAAIALGSNLDQPAQQLTLAVAALAELPQTVVGGVSRFYRTAPVGYADQPDFVNAAAWVETQLSAEALLDALLTIEQRFGRVRTFANAPRVLDLDLLLYDDSVMLTEKLTLPHPRMHERLFVLMPLADIAADWWIPSQQQTVAVCLANCLQSAVGQDITPL